MILIDKCGEPALKLYLQRKGLKDTITVAWSKELKQSSDKKLIRLCNENNALLITKDKEFFDSYKGIKLFISNGRNYEDIPHELQYKLHSDSELERLAKKVIELNSFLSYLIFDKIMKKT
jgi:hypothetical protein